MAKESEFGGRGPEQSGVFNNKKLNAWEKLRLIYRTGQDKDATAPVDPDVFAGRGPYRPPKFDM